MAKYIEYTVELNDTIAEFMLSPGEANALAKKVLGDITSLVVDNWKAHAARALSSTRERYSKGIIVVERGRLTNAIILVGALNNMIEFGISAFDMKIGFLKSSKVKISKTGARYLTIPFRWASPGALGESEAFSGVLPREVHRVTKAAKGTALKLKDIPEDFREKKTRAAINTGISKAKGAEYIHKSGLFEGISKVGSTGQSGYQTMRRVSDNPKTGSAANAWIHKGLKAYNLAVRAMGTTDFQTQTDNSIDEYLASR